MLYLVNALPIPVHQRTSMNDDNPFSTPSASNPYSPTAHGVQNHSGSIDPASLVGRGMVGQVQVLGVLMIVQGVLISLMGVFIGGYALMMPQFLNQMQQQQQGAGPPMPQQAVFWMTVGGSIVAVLALAIGVGTIYAGINTLKFRKRTFSIVMLLIGLLTLFTCYCLPTQIALSIYGLVVLLNAPVMTAYSLAEQGHSVQEIQHAFLSAAVGTDRAS